MARRRKPEPVEYDEDDDDTPRRPARRAVDEDDDAVDDLNDDGTRKPRDDAYTGLLVIALVALVGACVFWYLDSEALGGQQVSPPTVNVGGLGQQPAAAG